MRTSLFIILSCTALAACFALSREDQIKQEIVKANYCDTSADCEDAGGQCPFGCYVYVNKNERQRISSLMRSYDQKQCVYSCIAITGVECSNHTCQTINPPLAHIDGNIGAACTADSECTTPTDYLSRSSWPYTSKCFQGACAVVVTALNRDSHPDPRATISCENDAGCECGMYGPGPTQGCACIGGVCAAVIEK